MKNRFPSKPVCKRINILFSNKHFVRILPLIVLWIASGYMPAVFLTAWGSAYFGGCSDDEVKNDDCKLDVDKWNRLSSIFISLAGLIAFLFSPLLGRISDSYGRKPIFYLIITLYTILFLPLIFYPDPWIYFIIHIPAGLIASENSYTPSMLAYLSDTLSKSKRMFAYSVGYAFAAIGLL